MDGATAAQLQALPQVQKLLELPGASNLADRYGRAAVVEAFRAVLTQARGRLRNGSRAAPSADDVLSSARALLAEHAAPGLRRVINATGIILHTNLGRAPMPPEAAEAAAAVARGYCNLEFDLATGGRGSRMQAVEPLLRALTGAEAGLAVNNCAAAMLLALAALAGDGEVIVSRGELVEIGGGFRIPDVIRQGGARLVEVGTTNKTRLADYRDAITPETRVLLKVHQSNFQIVGFTESVEAPALSGLAQERGLLLIDDLGSGTVTDLRRLGRPPEATVQESVAAGADVVAFSGDKLLGGPQMGLLVGRSAAVDTMRRHPLLRALRPDKMSLAALEATLRLHNSHGHEAIPALRAMGQSAAALRARAERLAAMLGPFAQAQATQGFAGGGALPNEAIASAAVALHVPAPDQVAARLRAGAPAVVGRIADGCLLLDMLTVPDSELAELAASVHMAMGSQQA